MTVGIDGGALSITDDRLKVGVYRVAYNLVKELPHLDAKINYRVYGFGRGEEGTVPHTGNQMTLVRLPRPGFAKLWQPLELVRHRVNAYLGIAQVIPYTLYDVNTVGFVYDVGFLTNPEFYRESYFSLVSQTESVVRRSRHIITISEASAESIRKAYGISRDRLTVAYLGIEPCFHITGKKYRAAYPYFLFAGALKPGKNVPMMLRAFAEFLRTARVPYDLLLVGSDYWLDPGIPATISALGLRDRVKVVGFVDDEALASYYRGAVALLSVSRIEGFGLPVVEAMACGTPVIGSTAGSVSEVIGDAGLIVGPDDEQALVYAMHRVAADSGVRERLIRLGRERARHFSWRTFAQAVYSRIRA